MDNSDTLANKVNKVNNNNNSINTINRSKDGMGNINIIDTHITSDIVIVNTVTDLDDDNMVTDSAVVLDSESVSDTSMSISDDTTGSNDLIHNTNLNLEKGSLPCHKIYESMTPINDFIPFSTITTTTTINDIIHLGTIFTINNCGNKIPTNDISPPTINGFIPLSTITTINNDYKIPIWYTLPYF